MYTNKIICKSNWKKGDKICSVYGSKDLNEQDYTFRIRGWNPLPCKSFKGSYTVLADWLIANGWERVICDCSYLPDRITYIYK